MSQIFTKIIYPAFAFVFRFASCYFRVRPFRFDGPNQPFFADAEFGFMSFEVCSKYSIFSGSIKLSQNALTKNNVPSFFPLFNGATLGAAECFEGIAVLKQIRRSNNNRKKFIDTICLTGRME